MAEDFTLAAAPIFSRAMPDCVAVDIGNSRIKIGRFNRADQSPLPQPASILDISITDHATGHFDAAELDAWCRTNVSSRTEWLIGTVHRTAGQRLVAAANDWSQRTQIECPTRILSFRDIPLQISVDEPSRVGVDRLLGAVAANRLRQADRAAIIVDLGTAITVDLLDAGGTFAGGAILPGIGMSARALAEQTDALPRVAMEHLEKSPSPLGKSTEAAIQAGLYWGAVGAIRELITMLASGMSQPPELFFTGGASQQVAQLFAQHGSVHHVPHLVLAGIAIVNETTHRA
jgi:type III pantothenate kinase